MRDNSMLQFCVRLKEYRTSKFYSQRELAEIIGVNNSTLSRWEKGLGEPKIEELVKLAFVMNVSIDELVGKEEFIGFRDYDISECQLIKDYRQLDKSDKEKLNGIIKVLKNKG